MNIKAIYKTCTLGCALLFATHAKATYIITLEQVGYDVVATGSGTIDTKDLTFQGSLTTSPSMSPGISSFYLGTNVFSSYLYSGALTGPASFGTATGKDSATSGSGNAAGLILSSDDVVVPVGYVSGTSLSSQMTFTYKTLASLGVTTGTYTWNWGSGADADSMILYAGVPEPTAPNSAVPEPASLLLLGSTLAGFGVLRARKLRHLLLSA